jgi:integrase
MSFKKYCELYIALNEDNWKPSYLDKQKGIVFSRFNAFMSKDVRDIKSSDIRLWLKSINDVGAKSKKHYLSALNGVFKMALYDDVIEKNPMRHIEPIKYKSPKIKPFTSDEVNTILEASKDLNFNFVCYLAVGFYTGMRTGEILALKKNEVDLNNKTISINSTVSRFGEGEPKTFGSKRVIPLLDSLLPYFDEMLKWTEHKDYVFKTRLHSPYRDSNSFVNYFWKPLLKKLDFEYRRPYNMRHTFATNMLYRNLCTPLELSQILGHTTTEMVYSVYVSYLDTHLEKFDRSISIYS